jgi:hypothetical protein
MKSIAALKNPDIVKINDDEYQVITHDSQLWGDERAELIMIVGFVKIGVYALTPTHYLTYINEFPDDISRWCFFSSRDPDSDTIPIETFDLDPLLTV